MRTTGGSDASDTVRTVCTPARRRTKRPSRQSIAMAKWPWTSRSAQCKRTSRKVRRCWRPRRTPWMRLPGLAHDAVMQLVHELRHDRAERGHGPVSARVQAASLRHETWLSNPRSSSRPLTSSYFPGGTWGR
eukprot:1413456-Pyramimonas_sp.AAC.1